VQAVVKDNKKVGIYSEKELDDLEDNDEISARERWFMKAYLDAEE